MLHNIRHYVYKVNINTVKHFLSTGGHWSKGAQSPKCLMKTRHAILSHSIEAILSDKKPFSSTCNMSKLLTTPRYKILSGVDNFSYAGQMSPEEDLCLSSNVHNTDLTLGNNNLIDYGTDLLNGRVSYNLFHKNDFPFSLDNHLYNVNSFPRRYTTSDAAVIADNSGNTKCVNRVASIEVDQQKPFRSTSRHVKVVPNYQSSNSNVAHLLGDGVDTCDCTMESADGDDVSSDATQGAFRPIVRPWLSDMSDNTKFVDNDASLEIDGLNVPSAFREHVNAIKDPDSALVQAHHNLLDRQLYCGLDTLFASDFHCWFSGVEPSLFNIMPENSLMFRHNIESLYENFQTPINLESLLSCSRPSDESCFSAPPFHNSTIKLTYPKVSFPANQTMISPPSFYTAHQFDQSTNDQQSLPPRFMCEACGKVYSTLSGLSKHKSFHCVVQVQKDFRCSLCVKSYSSHGALKMHIRTHTLPCKCVVCGKAFSRPWLLQGHMRTHTGEKPFSCHHCRRAFADRSNLRAHMQTHSDAKKYHCRRCCKSFSRMSLLLRHVENSCLPSLT